MGEASDSILQGSLLTVFHGNGNVGIVVELDDSDSNGIGSNFKSIDDLVDETLGQSPIRRNDTSRLVQNELEVHSNLALLGRATGNFSSPVGNR